MGVNSIFSQFLEDEWQCDYAGDDTNCPYYIKSQDAYGIYYAAYGFYPEFTMDVKNFYKLQMNAESELWYGGTIAEPESNPISLNTGWNWIKNCIMELSVSFCRWLRTYPDNHCKRSRYYGIQKQWHKHAGSR